LYLGPIIGKCCADVISRISYKKQSFVSVVKDLVPEQSDINKFDRWKRSGLKIYNGKWAETYDSCLCWKIISSDVWDKTIINQLGLLPGNIRILDVGCATGRLLESLANAGVKNLHGVDIASRIVESAKRRLANRDIFADIRTADAEENLPWPNSTFDLVTLTGVLHHFTHPDKALAEIYRVLNNKGQLLILEPLFFTPIRQLSNLFLRFFPLNGDYHFYTPKGVTSLLKECKFTGLSSKSVTWYLFLVVGEKA
jgi:ubiquinone/menaquinone biosynthesis C-methylase UbiE